VFTHISDLAEAWLLELRRILRRGGRLFITVQDNNTIKHVLDDRKEPRLYDRLRAYEEKTRFRVTGFSMLAIDRAPGPGTPGQALVFYDLDYLVRHWSNYLTLQKTVPYVWGHPQTALILSK
jgi:hypothetical protein